MGTVSSELDLSVRSANCLERAGIILVGELIQKTPDELIRLRGMGKRSVENIQFALQEVGEKVHVKLDLDTQLTIPPWNRERATDDVLIQIMRLQQNNGGFKINKYVSERLGLSFSDLLKTEKRIVIKEECDKMAILSTVILIPTLEKKFSMERPFMSDIIMMHRKWLQRSIKYSTPTIDGLPFEKWIEERIQLMLG